MKFDRWPKWPAVALVCLAWAGGTGAKAEACFDDPTRECLFEVALKIRGSGEYDRDQAFLLRTYLGALRGDDTVGESLRTARDMKSNIGMGARIESLSIIAGVTGNTALFREVLDRIYRDLEDRALGYGIAAREALKSGMTRIATEAMERIVREGWGADYFVLTLGSYITKPENAFAEYGTIRGAGAALEFLDRQLAHLSSPYRQQMMQALAERLISLRRLDEASAVARHIRILDIRDFFEVSIAAARDRDDAKGSEGRARRIKNETLQFRALAVVAAASRDQALTDELKRKAQSRDNRFGMLAFLARAQAEYGAGDAAVVTIDEMSGDKGWQAQALFDVAVALKRVDLASRALKLSHDSKELGMGDAQLIVNRALRLWR